MEGCHMRCLFVSISRGALIEVHMGGLSVWVSHGDPLGPILGSVQASWAVLGLSGAVLGPSSLSAGPLGDFGAVERPSQAVLGLSGRRHGPV